MLLEPAVPPERWPWISLLTGLAVTDALRDVAGVGADLKWPNDVLVGDRKLAGILVERIETPGRAGAVVGVGINVSSTRADLPVETATSLALEGAGELDPTLVLAGLLDALGRRYDAWHAAGGDPRGGLHAAYRARCTTVGRRVRVHLPRDAVLDGEAVDVDPDGHLVVEAAGHRHVLGVGDVVHVRPGGVPPAS